MSDVSENRGIWFVYDGECPFCSAAAVALRIKKEYGTLHLLNAREPDQSGLIEKISAHGIDLDEGMVIYDGQHYFHAQGALRFMARYGDTRGAFNLSNKALFWSNSVAKLLYPWMRSLRNLILRQKKISRIDNLQLKEEPIFKSIFDKAWSDLPPVIQHHYANRPYTDDVTTVEGTLDVMCAGPLKWFAPVFWLLGGIPPHTEKKVPVTVRFESDQYTKAFHFKREFHFKTRKPYRFQSRMIPTGDNEVIEMMRFGIGWHMQYLWQDDRVMLRHKGYVLSIFGHYLPLPLSMLLGEGNAQEIAIDDNHFEMCVDICHPLWGKIYEYKGRFNIKEST